MMRILAVLGLLVVTGNANAQELKLGARIDGLSGLSKVRTQGEVTHYTSARPAQESAGLAVASTEVAVKDGVVTNIQATLQPDSKQMCPVGELYKSVLEGLWQIPYPEVIASDSVCRLSMDAGPGRSADACVGEGMIKNGRRTSIFAITASAKGDRPAVRRVVVEWALEPASAKKRDDADHPRQRLTQAASQTQRWEQQIGVLERMVGDPAVMNSAGFSRALATLGEVRRDATCARHLAIVTFNNFMKLANARLSLRDTSIDVSVKQLTPMYKSMSASYAAANKRDEGLMERMRALLSQPK